MECISTSYDAQNFHTVCFELGRVHPWDVFGWHLFLVKYFEESKGGTQQTTGNIQAIQYFN
jgi:hypothetical protein